MSWRRSSYSGSDGNCVEVRSDLAAVRDSKHKDGCPLTAGRFREFVRDVKAGRFDR